MHLRARLERKSSRWQPPETVLLPRRILGGRHAIFKTRLHAMPGHAREQWEITVIQTRVIGKMSAPRYNRDLRSEVQTSVSSSPAARVHRVEWVKVMNGSPVEINPSFGSGFKVGGMIIMISARVRVPLWDSHTCGTKLRSSVHPAGLWVVVRGCPRYQ